MPNNLCLKWGTVKEWDFESEDSEVFRKLQKYLKNSSLSCIADRPDDDRKRLLCDIIDIVDGDIIHGWTDKLMSKQEAKDYVMNYGK